MKKRQLLWAAVAILIVAAMSYFWGWRNASQVKVLQTHFLLEQPFCNTFVVFWLQEDQRHLTPHAASDGVWVVNSGEFSAVLNYAEEGAKGQIFFWSKSDHTGLQDVQLFRNFSNGSFPAPNAMITAQDETQSSSLNDPRIGVSLYKLQEGIDCEGADGMTPLQPLFQRYLDEL